MKKYFILILLLLVLFTSCDIAHSDFSYEINLVTIALDYQNTNVRNLFGTLNDAKEVEKAIRSNCEKQEINYSSYNYYQSGYSHNTTTVNNVNYPSKTHIINALDNLESISHTNSINIIYFSGHSNSQGSWLLATDDITNGETFDSENELNEDLLIRVDEVYNKLKNVKGKILLVVDSCYSGSFYRENSYSLKEENMSFANAFKKLISKDSEISDTYILCATEKDNTAYEPNFNVPERLHGYFTKALLEGLGWCDGDKGLLTQYSIEAITDENGVQGILSEGIPPASRNKILSVDSLLSYIKRNQDIALNGITHQYPQVSGGRFDLVLFDY